MSITNSTDKSFFKHTYEQRAQFDPINIAQEWAPTTISDKQAFIIPEELIDKVGDQFLTKAIENSRLCSWWLGGGIKGRRLRQDELNSLNRINNAYNFYLATERAIDGRSDLYSEQKIKYWFHNNIADYTLRLEKSTPSLIFPKRPLYVQYNDRVYVTIITVVCYCVDEIFGLMDRMNVDANFCKIERKSRGHILAFFDFIDRNVVKLPA